MFAEELVVYDAEAPLWKAIQPLLNAALRLEKQEDDYTWYGWKRVDIVTFLRNLPVHCSLLVGVWEVEDRAANEKDMQEREMLTLGCICEVHNGEVNSIRTFDALVDLSPIEQLEPGLPHALELIRLTRDQVAPVAWALFTDKETWDKWLFTEGDGEAGIDKGELIASFARQGRCVLLGSQTAHYRT